MVTQFCGCENDVHPLGWGAGLRPATIFGQCTQERGCFRCDSGREINHFLEGQGTSHRPGTLATALDLWGVGLPSVLNWPKPTSWGFKSLQPQQKPGPIPSLMARRLGMSCSGAFLEAEWGTPGTKGNWGAEVGISSSGDTPPPNLAPRTEKKNPEPSRGGISRCVGCQHHKERLVTNLNTKSLAAKRQKVKKRVGVENPKNETWGTLLSGTGQGWIYCLALRAWLYGKAWWGGSTPTTAVS